ncbi:MAG: acetyl-CoA carboxylase biotin carboxylase subunit [Dethiobacter sp.]|nr:acetyl-CoA carboxylase biotin carboxylase subunit [Dethiobacter sp.]
MFKKILIANRGEIAVRVMRACRELGIAAVAVYSDADREALHVKLADEKFYIGEPPVSRSYLNMDRIINAALESGAEAIHPGYGLLSENHEFAHRCSENGLVFIGPSPESIRLMGNKLTARRLLSEKGVPVVPGCDEPLQDEKEALLAAEKIGYPVMLKAAAGGGGIGMAAVASPEQMPQAFKECSWRGKASFGSETVYLEKLIENPRHIEVQVLGDKAGNVGHLLERECSVQRRHQKIIEEAPSPFVDTELRDKLTSAALMCARAIRYENVGTVEFIVGEDREPYFLEMNTRLQVEHAVTEMITGLDLVHEQIKIACGQQIPLTSPKARGWALECRVCAEDPETLLPAPGRITDLSLPERRHLRIDHGLLPGYKVSAFYDSLLAKVVVWGESREAALLKMVEALQQIEIGGIKTNLPLLLRVLGNSHFKQGRYDTNLLSVINNSGGRQ